MKSAIEYFHKRLNDFDIIKASRVSLGNSAGFVVILNAISSLDLECFGVADCQSATCHQNSLILVGRFLVGLGKPNVFVGFGHNKVYGIFTQVVLIMGQKYAENPVGLES